jgi:hypothetical protein
MENWVLSYQREISIGCYFYSLVIKHIRKQIWLHNSLFYIILGQDFYEIQLYNSNRSA